MNQLRDKLEGVLEVNYEGSYLNFKVDAILDIILSELPKTPAPFDDDVLEVGWMKCITEVQNLLEDAKTRREDEHNS